MIIMAEKKSYSMAFDKGALVIFTRTDTLDDKGSVLKTTRDETRINAVQILKLFEGVKA